MRLIWSFVIIFIIGLLLFLWLWGIPSPATDIVKNIPLEKILKS